MEKTAKITRTTFKNVWNNPKGGQVFYHEIELDNGDKGQIGCKDQMPEKINPGKELTYTIEVNEKGSKIKAVIPAQQNAGNWPKGGRTAPEPRVQMISFAMAYTKDLVVAGKLELKDLPAHFHILYNEMISKL